MAQQNISDKLENTGADSRRVLDLLTPVNGTAAPAVNAKFLGQLFIDTANTDVYMATKVGDVTPANDWTKIYG